MQASEKQKAVLVYNGEGAGSRSVLSALETLTRSLPELQVCSLNASLSPHCTSRCQHMGCDVHHYLKSR